MGIFTSQTKRYYSIRKYKIGVCSALIALSILGTRVAANQLPSTETASPQTSQLVETTSEATEVANHTTEPVTTSEVSSEASPVTSTESQPSSTTAETLASPQAVQATKEEKNLVANGEFISATAPSGNWKESAATDWETWIPNDIKKENGAVSIDDGKLHISSTNTYRVAVHQTVDVDPSKRYLFSYDVETKDLKGSGVRVRLRSLTAEGKDLSPQEFTFTNFVAGTQQRKVEKELTVSPETRKLKVELFFENGIGQAWLDNISLVEYAEKTPETPESSPELVQPETGKITLASNKVYLPVRPDLTYRIADATVATVEKNMIRPLVAGKTQVDIYDKDTKLSSFELTVTKHQATVFDTLRNNWEDISLANKRYQSNDTQMKAFLGRLDAGVASSLKKWVEPTEQGKTIFNDIDFSKSSHLTTVYRRLEQMAQVVENPDSTYYHDRSLTDLVRKGMNWLYTNVYNENKSIDGNWWDYEIGTPRAVVNTLIYMYPYFSQEEILTYTKPISKFVPDPTTIRKTLTNPVPAVGGNQTDLSKVAILEGALREDADRVRAGAQGLTTIMKFVDKGEGFYKDGSFIDHTNVAYTGAYGNVLIEGFSQLLPVIQPTEFALKEEQTNILYEWIEKAFMPILVRGELMDMTRGRSISRATGESHVQAMEILRSLVRIAESAQPEQKNKLLSFVKAQLTSDTFYDSYRSLKSYKDIDLVNKLLADNQIPAEVDKDYIAAFNNMDKFVYRSAQEGFTFALSMYSSRTQNYEDMNNENRKGWYTADGMVYLYNDDLSHYSNHYWATVDPYRLPGTTTTKDKREDGSGEVTLASDFVGASQLGNRLATIAMDFNNWNNSLTARKAWIVLGNKIVFLGTDIQHQSAQGAVTTIENRKLLTGEKYSYYINGQPVDLSKEVVTDKTQSFYMTNGKDNQSIGYVFLNQLPTHAKLDQRTGKWSDINYNQSKEEVSNSFVSLWHEHAQTSSNYAYVLVPNQSMEKVNQAAASVKLLHQDKDLQVVYDQEQNVWGVVKYTDTAYKLTDDITLTDAGLYTIQKVEGGYRIAFYNPSTRTVKNGIELTKAGSSLTVEMEPTAAYPSTVWKITMPEGSDKQTGSVEKTEKEEKQLKENQPSPEVKQVVHHAAEKTKPSKPRLPQTGEEASLGLGFLGLLTLGAVVDFKCRRSHS